MRSTTLAQRPGINTSDSSTPTTSLQRTCACGQHSHGTECTTCRTKHATILTRPSIRAIPRSAEQAPAQTAQQVLPSKTEAVANALAVEDDRAKVEIGTGGRALIGAGIGAGTGALIGAFAGGPLGALIGAGIGALVGAGVGALTSLGSSSGASASARVPIQWPASNYASDAGAGASTTVEQPFSIDYKAVQDPTNNVWRMRVNSISGGVDMNVHTGGSRDPFATPPTAQPEAQTAVTDMKGYYARGSRGAWHTEAASHTHEEHHYREWRCASDHYWALANAAIENLSVPMNAHANEASAITAMRGGATGADSIQQSFQQIARKYWFILADNASSRPYAAGQLVLNQAITHVQNLAAGKSWIVPQGVDTPSPEPPCYEPWLPYP
jgi:hypothetical protein